MALQMDTLSLSRNSVRTVALAAMIRRPMPEAR